MNSERSIHVSITTGAIVKVLAGLAMVALLVYLRDVAVTVFVAFVVATALDPMVTRLERRGIPRGWAITLLFAALLAFLASVVVLFVPIVADQGRQLVSNVPAMYQRWVDTLRASGHAQIAGAIEGYYRSASQNVAAPMRRVFPVAVNLAQGIAGTLAVLVLTFYVAANQEGINNLIIRLAPPARRPRIARVMRGVEHRLGHWLRGQLLLGAIIGATCYVALLLFGVRYAVVLGMWAGITELIPIIGPFLGGVPAVLVAIAERPILGLWVGIAYLGIQQAESHLIVPRIMARSTGIHPITVLIAMLIGARIAGIVGIMIAVPAAIIVTLLFEDWMEHRESEKPSHIQAEPRRAEDAA